MFTPEVEDLKGRAVRGTAAVFASQALHFGLNVAVSVTLARLLSPEDFGVFAIAFAVTGFLEFAKSGGMVVPVIQSETISHDQLDTLFWFNTGIGVCVAVCACLIAPIFGYVYGDSRLAPVISALALTFILGGLSTQHVALLRRTLRFTTLAGCEAAALAIASGVAIFAALHGAHYWSLVYLTVTREALLLPLAVIATRWIPAWPRRWANIAPLVRFGGLMMAFDVMGYLTFKLDNLIVGWYLGAAVLGFYDKAYQFLLMPVNQITIPLSNVVHATLSRLQTDPDRFRAYLNRALLLATSLGMPLTAFLFGNAATIIEQLLGARWLPSLPIFEALAPAAFVMTITSCVGWIALALGRARRQLPWTVAATAATVCAFLVGVHWGAAGVAAAFSIARVGLLIPTLQYTCSGTGVKWSGLLATAARPAFASIAALIISMLVTAGATVSAWTLPRNALIFAVLYTTFWVLIPGGRILMRQNIQLVGTLAK
ncbi:MAG: lipopolysaccharide biosynthesis protein [Vicinamibacterales bacterium]